jgi:hypothetical protein
MEAKMDLVPTFTFRIVKWMFQQCESDKDVCTVLHAVNAIYEHEDRIARERCRIEGCEGKPVGKGLCWKHYQRQRRHGDPSVVKLQRRSDALAS